MVASNARVNVEPPTVLPYRYGLLSTATVNTGDGRWQLGVQYPAPGCIEGAVWDHGWCIRQPGEDGSTIQPPPPEDSLVSSGSPAVAPTFTVTFVDVAGAATITVEVHTAPGATSNTLHWGDSSSQQGVPIEAGGTYTHTYTPVADDRQAYTVSATGKSPGAAPEEPPVVGTSTVDVELPWWTHPVKTLPDGHGPVTGDPFTVYAGITCPKVGQPDLAAVARSRLARTEQQQLEQHVWVNQLATPDAEILNPGGTPENPTPVFLPEAIGLLEDHTAEKLGGIGVIHTPRETTGRFSHYGKGYTHRDGPVHRTQLDTPVAYGAGYLGTGPGGTEPGGGQVWMYATGPVVIRRSEVFVPATETTGGFNTATNHTFVVAERTYVVTTDCVHAAVLVNLHS